LSKTLVLRSQPFLEELEGLQDRVWVMVRETAQAPQRLLPWIAKERQPRRGKAVKFVLKYFFSFI
jgi:hypothetical protein